MQALPHHYTVSARAESASNLKLSADNLPTMEVAPPPGCGGPGDVWSPEDLLMSSVASCTILSFRAIARASKLEWISLNCTSVGTLDSVERRTQFTEIVTRATLTITDESDRAKAEKLLHKAEDVCLVSNSLTSRSSIDTTIIIADKAAE
ncbi:MAG: OsmC family protein [Kangiellaceae bacterium]|nr:OsmC family protein [Kangiellaceae bacterium]